MSSDIWKWYNLERIEYKDFLYFVLRKVNESKIKKQEDIKKIRKYLGSDKVLRRGGFIYFCQQIEDAQIIETIDEKQQESTQLVKRTNEKEEENIRSK